MKSCCTKIAEDDYYKEYPLKRLELRYMDHSRRSMYKELQTDYERNLSWARSLGIGTFISTPLQFCGTCTLARSQEAALSPR